MQNARALSAATQAHARTCWRQEVLHPQGSPLNLLNPRPAPPPPPSPGTLCTLCAARSQDTWHPCPSPSSWPALRSTSRPGSLRQLPPPLLLPGARRGRGRPCRCRGSTRRPRWRCRSSRPRAPTSPRTPPRPCAPGRGAGGQIDGQSACCQHPPPPPCPLPRRTSPLPSSPLAHEAHGMYQPACQKLSLSPPLPPQGRGAAAHQHLPVHSFPQCCRQQIDGQSSCPPPPPRPPSRCLPVHSFLHRLESYGFLQALGRRAARMGMPPPPLPPRLPVHSFPQCCRHPQHPPRPPPRCLPVHSIPRRSGFSAPRRRAAPPPLRGPSPWRAP
ncbi:hypothetical protein T484DRAFT_1935935 [Baffinella frigidus]|nr:hypothetical protein T484DRAFT_1935935 [Cryptophyta sp. CCMP2293]